MNVNFNILNQKGAPAVYEDSLANRPAATYPGRLFVDTDVVSTGIYRDNGTNWDLVASPGTTSIPTWWQTLQAGGVFNSSTGADLNNEMLQFVNVKEFAISNVSSVGLFRVNGSTTSVQIGDVFNSTVLRPKLNIDVNSKIITTVNNLGNNGFLINLFSNEYFFGQISGANRTFIYIEDTPQKITFISGGAPNGFFVDYNTRQWSIGDFANFGQGIAITSNNVALSSRDNNGINGFSLSYNTKDYIFGQITGSNLTQLQIGDISGVIRATRNGLSNGFRCDISSGSHIFGQINPQGALQSIALSLSSNTKRIQTTQNGILNGIDFNFNTHNYIFGRITGGNGYNITIDDTNSKFNFNGTGATSGTAGGASGQHLIIWINGTQYKINLLNP